ncbi:MAG: ComF family protein [endosymbiont of Escarpia spicata]|uniref:ComF family protein n=1 Tax=endosymbiont of Escarpia spicata TaxID=2200908 RepID=A0A370DBE2_9GAMM|nr:MAG: ComF family protein [endosymbiont of Escarpia spicata]
MVMKVYNWIDFALNRLYASRCRLCGDQGANGRDLCPDCKKDLSHNQHCCRVCAIPLPPAAPENSLCGSCSQQHPGFEQCLAALVYDQEVGQLVSGLKFRNQLGNARLLGDLLCGYLEGKIFEKPDFILPVPLHRSRLKTRGYNQALEIARPVGRRFGIPLRPKVCARNRATEAQADLDKGDRGKNIRGAFSVKKQVSGRRIVLLDDVVTTGNTVSELTRVLRQAGAARVDVWAVARTP